MMISSDFDDLGIDHISDTNSSARIDTDGNAGSDADSRADTNADGGSGSDADCDAETDGGGDSRTASGEVVTDELLRLLKV